MFPPAPETHIHLFFLGLSCQPVAMETRQFCGYPDYNTTWVESLLGLIWKTRTGLNLCKVGLSGLQMIISYHNNGASFFSLEIVIAIGFRIICAPLYELGFSPA